MGWKALLFLSVMICILFGTITPSLKRVQAAGNRTSALSGCKSLAGGLAVFKAEHGSYPGPETRAQLIEKGSTRIPMGTDANAYLAQLIVTGAIDSETYFHCKAGKGYHEGDDHIDSPDNILAPGENSYAYIMAEGEKPLTQTYSLTPLVMAPIVSGGPNPTFDPYLLGYYYVYGAADGSGKQGKIDSDGVPLSKGRTSLFQTGEDSLFGNQTPDVKMPREGKTTIAPSVKDWSYALLLIPLAAFFRWASSTPKKAQPEEPTPEAE